jgi:hypothetical protein
VGWWVWGGGGARLKTFWIVTGNDQCIDKKEGEKNLVCKGVVLKDTVTCFLPFLYVRKGGGYFLRIWKLWKGGRARLCARDWGCRDRGGRRAGGDFVHLLNSRDSLVTLTWSVVSFFLILKNNKTRLMTPLGCLCVCVFPASTFQCLNQSIWNSVCMLWHLNPSQRPN